MEKTNQEILTEAIEAGTNVQILLGALAEQVTAEQLREVVRLAREQS